MPFWSYANNPTDSKISSLEWHYPDGVYFIADSGAEHGGGAGVVDPFISAVQEQIEEGLDRSGMYIYVIDRGCRFRYISPSAAWSIGRPQEDIIGRTPSEIGIPEDLCVAIKGLVDATFNGRKSIRGTFKTNVKGEELFEFDSTPVFAGGAEPVAVLALVFDRTAQAMSKPPCLCAPMVMV